jgi:hypothetical protein
MPPDGTPQAANSGPTPASVPTASAAPASGAAPRYGAPAAGGPAPGGPAAGGPVPGGPKSLWKAKADGNTIFRHPAPLVLWWAWVLFAVGNLIDLAVSDHDFYVVRVGGLLLLVTGIMYACTLHSRVEADEDGVTVFNPLRDHRASWGAVEGIYLGDSVEFICARPAPKKSKTIYSWALYSRRRSRARAQMQRSFFTTRRTVNSRAPAEAADLMKQQSAQIMAAELGRRAVAAREGGAAGGVLRSQWAWAPLTAILITAILLVVILVIR